VYLGQIARHIYIRHADAAVELRKVIVAQFVKRARSWLETAEFERLLYDVPDLAADVVRALLGDSEVKVAKKSVERTAASGRSKRKRGGFIHWRDSADT